MSGSLSRCGAYVGSLGAMTHDPKFDVPLLEAALRSPAQFVGAMGSRRTTANRYHRLRAAALVEEDRQPGDRDDVSVAR